VWEGKSRGALIIKGKGIVSSRGLQSTLLPPCLSDLGRGSLADRFGAEGRAWSRVKRSGGRPENRLRKPENRIWEPWMKKKEGQGRPHPVYGYKGKNSKRTWKERRKRTIGEMGS